MATKDVWRTYVAHLKKNVPAAYANLAPGASNDAIERLEEKLGVVLPEAVKVVWRMNDGQRQTMLWGENPCTPCIPTMSFLSTRLVSFVWDLWDKFRRDRGEEKLAAMNERVSSPLPGVVKLLHTSPLWVPLWSDPFSDEYVGLDLDPGPQGYFGQIINFGGRQSEHFQYARTFDDLIGILEYEVRDGWQMASVWKDGEREVPWFGDPDYTFMGKLWDRWDDRNMELRYNPIIPKKLRRPKKRSSPAVTMRAPRLRRFG